MDKEKQISFTEFYHIKERYCKNYDDFNLFKKSTKHIILDTIEKEGIHINGVNITFLDFPTISRSISNDDFIKFLSKNLNIDITLKDNLQKISYCLEKSKAFWETFMRIQLPKNLKINIKKLSDLKKIIENCKSINPDCKLSYTPYYSALFKTAIFGYLEYINKDMEYLIEETKYLYKMFFKEYNGIIYFYRISHNKSEESKQDYETVSILVKENQDPIKAYISYRGKSENSIICKFLRTPNASRNEIIKDGLGYLFEVYNQKDALDLVLFLQNFLIKKLKAFNLTIEDTNFLSKENIDFLKTQIDEKNVIFISKDNKYNPNTHKSFQNIKIRGEIIIPVKGDKKSKHIKRHFEIQIANIDNKNNKKFAHHDVYRAKQILSTYSRLLYNFPLSYIELLAEISSKTSGISKEKIVEHIIKNQVKEINIGTTYNYVSKDQYNRLHKAKI